MPSELTVSYQGAPIQVLLGESTGLAAQFAAQSGAEADRAELAANGTAAAAHYFSSQAAGETGTATGEFFSHPDGSGGLVYRERTAGGSTIIGYAATRSLIDKVSLVVAIADLTADNSALINAALAVPGISVVKLPPGVIEIGSPIVGVNHRLLTGSGKGQTILKVKASFSYDGTNNAAIDAIGKTGFCVSDLTIRNEKVGWTGTAFTTRLNGVRHRNCTDYHVERVDAFDVSGYAFFAQGSGTSDPNITKRAVYRSCWAYNAHVDFEQMASEDVLLDDCHARLGTGDIPADAMFHPLLRSKNIHFQSCTGEDNGTGLLVVSSTGPMSNITMNSCRIVSNNFYALSLENNSNPAWAISGIRISNSHLESLDAQGINFSAGGPGAPILADNTTFKVSRASGAVNGLYLVRAPNSRFSNCIIEAYTGTSGATAATLSSEDDVFFDGALIASGVAGALLLPIGAATRVHLSPSSTITPSAAQNAHIRAFFQGQAVATTITTGTSSRLDLTLPGACLASTKAHLAVALTGSGVPTANLSARAELTTGSPFVTVWIRGDFGGQTLSWQFWEKF